MKTRLRSLATTVLCVALVSTASTAYAQDGPQQCQPGIFAAYGGPHNAKYNTLIGVLVPELGGFQTELAATVNAATYDTMLAHANAVAANVSLVSGRVLITLPDGTVVIDTARADNVPADPTSNSYQHFLDKTINENHNSRVAIAATQDYQCGFGIEAKKSSTTGVTEIYFGVRLGNHLDAIGSARLSTR